MRPLALALLLAILAPAAQAQNPTDPAPQPQTSPNYMPPAGDAAGRNAGAPVPGSAQPNPPASDSIQAATGANTRSDPPATGALGPVQQVPVAQLIGRPLHASGDEKVGEVERVVADGEGKTYLLVTFRGLLGLLGTKEVPVPTAQVVLRGDRLVTPGITDQELRRVPTLDRNARPHRDLDGQATAPIASGN
jgi:hypothetical protein